MSNHNGDDHIHEELEAAQLTAYALGQLQGEELAAVVRKLPSSGDGANHGEVHEIQALAAVLSRARASESLPQASSALRAMMDEKLAEPASREPAAAQVELAKRRKP